MKSCIIEDVTIICNLGSQQQSILNALEQGSYGTMEPRLVGGRPVPAGVVTETLPSIPQKQWQTRTNALILHCLQRLAPTWRGIEPEKLGVILGSSNSGIEEYHKEWQDGHKDDDALALLEVGNVAQFVAAYTGAKGPVYTLSTACSSSAKALASAARLLEAGICDAVIAGGGDALCHYALHGFDALQLISETRCRPFTLQGGGVNHGEGAALFLLTRREAKSGDIVLAGYGETADAYHTTTPEPGGTQAVRAMRMAMEMAGISEADIDYVNLHGTGTDANDSMEIDAMQACFGDTQPPCGSTKPYTGHTLGAAGALEAAFCTCLLQQGNCRLPQQPWLSSEPQPINNATVAKRPLRHCISNSFAFGGNNIALLLSRHD